MSTVSFSTTGCRRPVGSEFRQNLIRDDHRHLWAASYFEVLGGAVLELAPSNCDSRGGIMICTDPGPTAGGSYSVMKQALQSLDDEPDAWKAKTVRACGVAGCLEGLPMWEGRAYFENLECLRCRDRSVLSCRECGMPDQARYMQPIRDQMLERELCFGCRLWLERIEELHAGTADGSHVLVDQNWALHSFSSTGWGSPSSSKGYGGARWVVRLNEGAQEFKTDSLWCGGTVPEWFRERLPQSGTVEHAPREGRKVGS
jgi:hypothetical protein